MRISRSICYYTEPNFTDMLYFIYLASRVPFMWAEYDFYYNCINSVKRHC